MNNNRKMKKKKELVTKKTNLDISQSTLVQPDLQGGERLSGG
jgi:hypothetical protein